jgi:hypothetical protein
MPFLAIVGADPANKVAKGRADDVARTIEARRLRDGIIAIPAEGETTFAAYLGAKGALR